MRKRTTVLFLIVVLTMGCNATDENSSPSNDAPSPDVPSTTDSATPPIDEGRPPQDEGSPPEDTGPPPPIKETYNTFVGDWTMTPGQEVTKCVRKRLGNVDPIWVTSIQTSLNKGSHHVIVYRSDQDTEILEPENCDPFIETLGGETIPLIITQVSEETLTLPPGVAFKFAPHQMIRIEAHYLNYYDEDISAHADVSFKTIAQEDVEHEADMLFYGTPDFSIPAGKEHTTPWHFIDVWEDTKVFAVTGHTHQHGTNVEISKSTSADDEGDFIYPQDTPFTWNESPIEQYSPALHFSAGEGFRYRCTWKNTSNKSLSFGESANQEMCFLWAYYYPSKGYRMCVNPGGIAGGFDVGEQVCCPDDAFLCDLIKGFLSGGGGF